MSKKEESHGLTFNTLIVIVLALLVLIIFPSIFTGRIHMFDPDKDYVDVWSSEPIGNLTDILIEEVYGDYVCFFDCDRLAEVCIPYTHGMDLDGPYNSSYRFLYRSKATGDFLQKITYLEEPSDDDISYVGYPRSLPDDTFGEVHILHRKGKITVIYDPWSNHSGYNSSLWNSSEVLEILNSIPVIDYTGATNCYPDGSLCWGNGT